jgi:hypothetical protein
VLFGVGEKVVDHLTEAVGVSDDGHRLRGGETDGALGGRHPGRAHGGGDDGGEVDMVQRDGTLVVEPGQEQQVVHEHAHAVGLFTDVAHGGGQVLRTVTGAAVEELRVAADRREGGAQLVRGIGQEAPQAFL